MATGRLRLRVFAMELARGGLYAGFEKEAATDAELEELLRELRPLVPPMIEGDLALAADYIRGRSTRVKSSALERQSPDFVHHGVEDEGARFTWTREYPSGHWSPFARLGIRQVIGSVLVGRSHIVASAKTLSMTARLVATLGRLFGGEVRVLSARWEHPLDGKIYTARVCPEEREQAA